MGFELEPIPRVKGLDKETFVREYLRPKRPVILEDFANGWPALEKWDMDFIRSVAGDHIVPLYDNSKVDYSKKVNEPIAEMKMSDYIDILESGPTELRIFLYNIFKYVPELCDDFTAPEWAPRVLKSFPMMFFGGEGSNVFLHYDIDMSHVFHTNFVGEKKAILFDHKYKKELYKIPFAVHNVEDIDIDNPDFEKWPALANVKGLEAHLGHGDTLFMPSGWWHYMKYLTPSFSLSLRALDSRFSSKLKGLYNVAVMRQIDNVARKIGGQDWIDYKDRWAIRRAESTL
ncbi:MAG: cupin-like domain-containing protein [Bacteroidetes bacterium]|uniref:Cupin-like domain-containing protein n=1 Tax=Phaeocystidibacter marisrubri TaxID=1577780 RepID=A0A6L3ZDF3_9FLAO|nr:cupin-like domain-containing protein [Phaeocystidibacter marisrubri]KAB2815700.1 cupin-like domain-containing protein [Phaeocystidibacter marisrubri]TNE31101.1 MAG: cupin-like domain-containing protein [Bacteroidota bacterium]GGH65255.1 hypothetical protein GCM10011318_02080 [Phaeocystidibacter marisrubri]